jgi:hypothetical protein
MTCQSQEDLEQAVNEITRLEAKLDAAEAKVEALERQNTSLFDSHDEEYRKYEVRLAAAERVVEAARMAVHMGEALWIRHGMEKPLADIRAALDGYENTQSGKAE